MSKEICRAAAVIVAVTMLSFVFTVPGLAQDDLIVDELSPGAQRAIAESWLKKLNAFYESGDAAADPGTTAAGLERLRSFDWRFDAVAADHARFVESWDLVEGLPVDSEMTDGEPTAIVLRLTTEVADRAEGLDVVSGEPVELSLGRQRRVMLATFVREPGTEGWLLDDIGLPPGGAFDFGLLPAAAEQPCPGLSKSGKGADPFLVKPWCTAGGDGREVMFGRLTDRSEVAPELLVARTGCGWDDAIVMSLGWPPGAPRDKLEVREYIRDPRGQVPGADAYRRDVRKPNDAISTGITNGQVTIWTSEKLGEDAILIQSGSRFERWPRVTAGCTGN